MKSVHHSSLDKLTLSAGIADAAPTFTSPALPKGGGTISAGGGMLSYGGSDATATWSISLPLPAGRALAPSLTLSYSSGGGNSAFGAGWDCPVPAILRMTRFGIPRYNFQDRLVGPNGEEIFRQAGTKNYTGLPFEENNNQQYLVETWIPCSGGQAERLTCWKPATMPDSPGFWIQYHANGNLTLFGWSPEAKLADPADRNRVAGWYAEETISPTGEHIVYRFRQEDDAGCSDSELMAHSRTAGLYLSAIYAANKKPSFAFSVPAGTFSSEDYLYVMQLDYGEREKESFAPPSFAPEQPWSVRQDCFSFWRYGFHIRTRRLCRKVLLWAQIGDMQNESVNDQLPVIVSCLHLTYEESDKVSLLVAAENSSWEPEGNALTLPPIEFDYNRPGNESAEWESLTELAGFCPPGWQMADLYGEGISGLLYQDAGAWWYRAPQRKPGAHPHAVDWGTPRLLPAAPASSNGRLTDQNGDGRLEWLVNAPGLNGSFTLSPDGTWSSFIPLNSVPAELFHPSSLMADLTGNGLPDIVMVGPRSVRLWPSAESKGWTSAEICERKLQKPLPLKGGAERLVAFTDFSGSGQQHLVEITGKTVTCWPSLGYGCFAEPYVIPGFSVENFSAERLFLGDTDGSGCVDILYLEPDRIRVFSSQSGNHFKEEASVPAPKGVRLDATCTFQVVDFYGQGTAEMLLTVPHMQARTYLWRFNRHRPWLLTEICNNMGSRTQLEYSSSAQGWLDEKASLLQAGRIAISHLPFPVHMLSRVTQHDDISGLKTGHSMLYLRGVWDHFEREFCGFSRLIQTDTHSEARGSHRHIHASPSVTKIWFMTGVESLDNEQDDIYTDAEFTNGIALFPVRPVRIMQWGEAGLSEYATSGEAERRWLLRFLKGCTLRTEIYGLDGRQESNIPYSITRQRWQVCATTSGVPQKPTVMVMPVETLTLVTERFVTDPLVTQAITLAVDAAGTILQQVNICYPRRPFSGSSGYPHTLPDGLEAASRDKQQEVAWLTLTRNSVHHLRDEHRHIHVTGLHTAIRRDTLALDQHTIPENGFSVEYMLDKDSPLLDMNHAVLSGYTRTLWCDTSGNIVNEPVRQALTAATETAILDDASLRMFRNVMNEDALNALLISGGYRDFALPEDGMQVKVGRSNIIRYGNAEMFFQPHRIRDNELTGENVLSWSRYALAVIKTTDAAGFEEHFHYDWRFRTPLMMIDINDNVHETALDSLGRVICSRFHGTENGTINGYSTRTFAMPETIEEILQLKSIPVATAYRIVPESWMPFRRNAMGQPESSRCGELYLRRWCKRKKLSWSKIEAEWRAERMPPHVICVQTDRYDNDAEQQIRVTIDWSDGLGRSLQASALASPGEAMMRTADGGLKKDAYGSAILENAPVRWAVTGKKEYDDKGQPVRTWMPFYLNDWRPIYDDSARKGIYADTHVYDALGREIVVITAAGWEQRTQYYPWFIIHEDENDTAEEVISSNVA